VWRSPGTEWQEHLVEQDKSERHPETPDSPLDLDQAAGELLERAGAGAGRMARNLTPGEGAPLSQTLLALTDGTHLGEHTTNGQATLQVLRGAVTITSGTGDVSVSAGQWATVPREEHGLTADGDSVVLLTVAPLVDS
jgi:quercetin dioxygenase-like cupin family protein